MAENSNGSNVEFVGGVAVSQEERPEAGTNPNFDDAVEAVRKARKAEEKKKVEPSDPEKEEREEKPKAKAKKPADKDDDWPDEEDSAPKKPVQKAKDKADEDDSEEQEDEAHEEKPKAKAKSDKPSEEEEPEDSLKKVLAARKKTAQVKKQAADELQGLQQQIAQSKAELQQQYAYLQQEKQKLELFKKDPVAAVREFGYDPEEFVMALAQSGTPEGKQAMQLRQMQQELAQSRQFQENVLRQQRMALQQQEEQQQIAYRNHIENRFLGRAFHEESHPHIASFYKNRQGALIAEGDIVAAQYRELTGKEAPPEEIADYIEEQLAQSAKSWYESQSKQSRKVRDSEEEDDLAPAEEEEVEEVRPKASGGKRVGRTLDGSAPRERRAVSKNYADLSDDERIEVARQEVRKAMAARRRADLD